jgi:hypothetical protein
MFELINGRGLRAKAITAVILIFLAAALVTAYSPLLGPEEAQAQSAGRIAGRVTSAREPGGVKDVQVAAYDQSHRLVSSALTASNGTYIIKDLPAGKYKVQFEPSTGSDYFPQWYKDKPDIETADAVAVNSGATTLGINALLWEGGRITGKVTSAKEPGGVSDVGVFVYDQNMSLLGDGLTGAGGAYTVKGLPLGIYKVYFAPPEGSSYLPQWYNNKPDDTAADAVTVTEGATTSGINALLKEGGKITGKVTSEKEPEGVEGVLVYALEPTKVMGISIGFTGPDGTYEIPSLPAGSYKIIFLQPPDSNYLLQWYDNKSSLETADVVEVAEGATTAGINALLKEGGRITGKVTSVKERGGVADVGVWVYDLNGNEVGTGWTGPDGTYEVPGLPTGRYKVKFNPPGKDNYFSQWFRNKDSLESADVVTVREGATTSGIDAVLSKFTYTIAATVSPAGSGTVSGTGAYPRWARVTLTATPAKGFRFVRWTMDGREVSTSPTLILTVAGDRSLVANFEASLPAPYISFISPALGSVGTEVTITGTGFGASRGTSYVSFGETMAVDYLSWSETRIRVRVPQVGAGSTKVTVTTSGGRSNYKSFYVISKR